MKILTLLWAENPLNVGQIIARIQPQTDWHENTIKTLINRLLKKQLVERKKDGKQYFYKPAISKESVIDEESQHFLKRFFDGKVSPLVAHFARNEKLSENEIKEIESILDEMRDTND